MFFNADPTLTFDSTTSKLDPQMVTHPKVHRWFDIQYQNKNCIQTLEQPIAKGLIINDGVVLSYNGEDQILHIPAVHEGQIVYRIAGHAFERQTQLKSVILPETLTMIDEWAFASCTHLENINLPDTLTSIGAHAFQYCHSLHRLNIPQKVNYIGSFAFAMCNKLCYLMVDTKNKSYVDKDGVLFFYDGSELIAYPTGRREEIYHIPEGTKRIAPQAFKCHFLHTDHACLREVIFPSSLEYIGSNAFTQCRLRSITIPQGVEVDAYAFSLNKEVERVFIEDGVVEINEGVLSGITQAPETLSLPNSVKKIGYRSFERLGSHQINLGCLEHISSEAFSATKSSSWHIPASVKTIENHAFYLSALKSVHFDKESLIEDIQSYAFAHCRDLKHVTLPELLSVIRDGVFALCTGLEDIRLPEQLQEIEDVVFAGSGLKSISFEHTQLEVMGSFNFAQCAYLVRAILSPALKSIGTHNFEKCSSLRELVIPENMSAELPQNTLSGIEHPVLISKTAKSNSAEQAHDNRAQRSIKKSECNSEKRAFKSENIELSLENTECKSA